MEVIWRCCITSCVEKSLHDYLMQHKCNFMTARRWSTITVKMSTHFIALNSYVVRVKFDLKL